jgi:hypothetical protein
MEGNLQICCYFTLNGLCGHFVFKDMKIAFCDVTPYSLLDRYQRLEDLRASIFKVGDLLPEAADTSSV